MKHKNIIAHLASIVTIIIWGTTFISTKVLLVDFRPVEILFFRFVIGFFVLMVIFPRRLKGTNWRQETTFMAAGLCGVCLYYLLENIALTYSLASNVGVIVSVAPFFTSVLTRIFLKDEEKMRINFYVGFVVAIIGISLVSFGGSKMEVNPMGDFLALLAAFVWACYSILTKEISRFGYQTILTTRRIFFYGIIFMIPALFFFNFRLDMSRFANKVYLFNIIFLGLGASALCFVTWNFAVKVLGAVRTSVYIYIVPLITLATSMIILHEQLSAWAVAGMILTLVGLFLSEVKFVKQK